MAKIFISYSTKDKVVANKLYSDLIELGHSPWLDEWNINVGECIPSKIQEGLNDSDYVVLLLSKRSVDSSWVDKEWKAKYWEEVGCGKSILLPVLIEKCNIPSLLKTKKYADFSKSYELGLAKLATSIMPVISENDENVSIVPDLKYEKVSKLLRSVQSRQQSLSESLTEALSLSLELKKNDLSNFCKRELMGWAGQNNWEEDDAPKYRLSTVYASLAQINPTYAGWGGNASIAFNYMRTNSDSFFPVKMVISLSVNQLENQLDKDVDKHMVVAEMPVSEFAYKFKSSVKYESGKESNIPVYLYSSAQDYVTIYENIRTELTKRLINLLPEINT